MYGIGDKFMEMTQYKHMKDVPQRPIEKQPPLERPMEQGAVLIKLPDPATTGFGREALITIINQRRSLRDYSEGSISMEELSFLLWCCQGVQQNMGNHTIRTVPSAGARHALETYILANRVDGLQEGVYHYSALDHALCATSLPAGIAGQLTAACLKQGIVKNSVISFFWAAELERMYYRYGERGFRYLLLDAGHACQNLCLAAESVGCGACAIGAFDDEELNKALGLDCVNRFVVYAAAVGKKPG
jgi:SagB-type dehydrogenase family enzyme